MQYTPTLRALFHVISMLVEEPSVKHFFTKGVQNLPEVPGRHS